MNELIKTIADDYYKKIGELRNTKSKWNKFILIFYILSIVSLVLDYIFAKQQKTALMIVFLGLCIGFLIATFFFYDKRNNDLSQRISSSNCRQKELIYLRLILRKNNLFKIESKSEIRETIEYANEFYKEKFKTINRIKKAFNSLCVVIIIPLVFSISDYVLNNIGDIYDKIVIIVYLFSFLFALYVICSVLLDFINEIIATINYKYKLLINDLKIISKFDVKFKVKIKQNSSRLECPAAVFVIIFQFCMWCSPHNSNLHQCLSYKPLGLLSYPLMRLLKAL